MRRLITIAAALALVLAFPVAALAHHGRGHHKRHDRHLRFRIERFEPANPAAAPTMAPNANAATVQSFVNGVLTIKLSDKSSVSGAVTRNTEIACEAPVMARVSDDGGGGSSGGHDGDGSGDNSSTQQSPTTSPQPARSDDDNGAEDNDREDQNEDQNENEPVCNTSDLVPGAVVREAELRLGPGGAMFKEIKLVK